VTIFPEDLIMLSLSRAEGQGLTEYALLLALIAVVVVLILALLGPQIGNLFSHVAPCISPVQFFCTS
jgi:pilus assembly protein Flp/PilA